MIHRPSPTPIASHPARPSGGARSVAVVLATVACLLAMASSAFAHTGLASSDPAEGAVLQEPLARIELTFTKPIELLPRTLWLTDPDGGDAGTVADVARSDDGMVVTGTFDEPLYAGRWQVHWRVLASDSHPREGVVRIAVDEDVVAPSSEPTSGGDERVGGDGPAAVAPPRGTTAAVAEMGAAAPSARTFEAGGNVMRSLYYLGLMVAVGLALFKAGPHRGEEANASGLARAVALGAAVGLVGGVGEVAFHAGALAGEGWSGTVDGATWAAISRTGLGNALALRVLGLVALLVAGLRRARRDVPSGPDPLKLLGAALVIASFQFVGHTASTAPEWAIRVADLTHVVAAAVWVGGLVGLALLSGHADRLGRARTAARFSTAASAAVIVVAGAGAVLAWLNLPDLAAVLGTDYGRLLLAKLALVAVLAALGAHNHFRVVPRLTDGDTAALDDLRRTVAVEVAVVLAVIVLTALLINTSPT